MHKIQGPRTSNEQPQWLREGNLLQPQVHRKSAKSNLVYWLIAVSLGFLSSAALAQTAQSVFNMRRQVEPLFYLDLEASHNRITNLTPQNNENVRQDLVTVDRDNNRETLVLGDFKDGFRVVTLSRLSVGIGPRTAFFYKDASGLKSEFWSMVGVLPVAGSESISVRYMKTMKEAREFQGPAGPPEDLNEVRSWAVGDSTAYAIKGGVLFIAGLGWGPVGVSGLALAQGSWTVYTERASQHEVYVKITRSNLTELSVSVNAAIISVGASQFKNADEGFSFRVRLDSDEGARIFCDLIHGNIAAAQIMTNQQSASVRYVQNEREQQTGQFSNFFFGIPLLLNTAWSTGRIDTFNVQDKVIDGMRADVHYGMFARQKRYTSPAGGRQRFENFYGASYKIIDTAETNSISGYFAKYNFDFSDNNANHWQLRLAIKELIRHTGVRQLMVNIPTSEDLDFVNLNFEAHFSKQNLDRLMDVANTVSVSEFTNRAMALHKAYFARMTEYLDDSTDPLDLCSDYGWDVGLCRRQTEHQLRESSEKMWSVLRELIASKGHDEAAFAHGLGELGEGICTNAFAFQAALNLIGEGLTMEMEISGTHLSVFRLALETTEQAGSYRVVSNGPTKTPLRAMQDAPDADATRHRGVLLAPGERRHIESPIMPPTFK